MSWWGALSCPTKEEWRRLCDVDSASGYEDLAIAAGDSAAQGSGDGEKRTKFGLGQRLGNLGFRRKDNNRQAYKPSPQPQMQALNSWTDLGAASSGRSTSFDDLEYQRQQRSSRRTIRVVPQGWKRWQAKSTKGRRRRPINRRISSDGSTERVAAQCGLETHSHADRSLGIFGTTPDLRTTAPNRLPDERGGGA